jgi:hypothetical protein
MAHPFLTEAVLQQLGEKLTYDVCFLTQFSQFSKTKNLMLFKLLTTSLSTLGLKILNSMLTLLAI